MTATHAFKTHLAASFTNASGEMIACYQMLSESDGYAYAIADFRDGKVERFDCSRNYVANGREFLREATELIKDAEGLF